jgi:hypothetical protein
MVMRRKAWLAASLAPIAISVVSAGSAAQEGFRPALGTTIMVVGCLERGAVSPLLRTPEGTMPSAAVPSVPGWAVPYGLPPIPDVSVAGSAVPGMPTVPGVPAIPGSVTPGYPTAPSIPSYPRLPAFHDDPGLGGPFLLTHAIPSPTIPDTLKSVPAPVGTSGSYDRFANATPTSYALEGYELELANFAGHRVEITGTLLPPAGPPIGYTPIVPGATPSATEPNTQRLRVTSVKMIANSCAMNG